jgi:alkanesulfonate monooxygenase SsuD/methylene tetrahydromethanopterin reductase-like flavin-dependent oxidoreductase (luciferase family)
MKLGLLIESEEGLDWQHWRQTYRTAERLGFESIWLSDHLSSPWSAERHGLEPWLALSVAAAETERLRFGPLVSPVTFREPALVARMAEGLANLSSNRFVLGLGLGWNADEHARFGIAFPPVAERTRRLADGLARIRDMLADSQVPILLGGSGPRSTLPLVARYADEWNLTTSSVEVYQERAARLATLCAAAGRDTQAIRHSVAAGVLIGRDTADLRARTERLRLLVPPLAGGHEALGWVAGTPKDVVDQLRPLAEAGVALAILGHYDLDDVATLELIANDVMPALA